MSELIVDALLVIGAIFTLLAGVGILRMPDLFMRASAAAKALTLGTGCLLAAVSFHFQEIGVVSRSALIIVFLFLTSPVSAHMISRAAYLAGVPLWKETFVDEMRERYDLRKGTLNSRPPDGDRSNRANLTDEESDRPDTNS